MANTIRNVAIIAHVDHGKTTLVDALLTQSKTKLDKDLGRELIMDSGDLERERGITIFSKNASVVWQGTKINIIDTPGHADFGGEVERVLKMADGCLLLIDAKEGPMPQTRFVLKKALDMGLKVIVVVNKIDRPDARIDYVLDKTLDLFIDLGADEAASDFPILYASAKEGKAGEDVELETMQDISPIFNTIIDTVPAPSGSDDAPLQMLTTSLSSDPHKGRIAIGRVFNGVLRSGQDIVRIKRDSTQDVARITSLMTFEGLNRIEVSEVHAGDIVAVAGVKDPSIGETIADKDNPQALPLLAIEKPTISATISVNDSPVAGLEGEYKTSRQINERLQKELETDMALKVEDAEGAGWKISGRGELHLAILVERMRREGYEFAVGKPHVIDIVENGKTLTPYEKVFIEVPEEYSGVVMKKLTARRGEMIDMKTEDGLVSLEFVISSRSFFGYRSEFVTDTRGSGIINTMFDTYKVATDYVHLREQGSLVAHESGAATAYAIASAQERGQIFVSPGEEVYKGQVVGQSSRGEDISVNICKKKALTNMRSKGDGAADYIKTPRKMSLEDALEYIADDELVEVTPKNIRMRKKVLDEREARRMRSQGKG